ncbi:hypothetical protein Cni_G15417 [Canna indica]|uniref:3'-5' exonuclease domain-containing protein n=1 Tax=Canna indica TaxID=4628 RepID=A0AAQ3KGY9_9LILI|nr:hypothetical protein Cni_G15417 [Canna indica]
MLLGPNSCRLHRPNMRHYGQGIKKGNGNEDYIHDNRAICLHAFSDLSHICPATFVFLLKECYVCGTRKATPKFRVLQQQVYRALHNAPQPGPFTFLIQCLYVVPLLGQQYTEGFSHMLISSVRHCKSQNFDVEDFCNAKPLAAQLVLDILTCAVSHEERILLKLLEAFDVKLKDIGDAIDCSDMLDGRLDRAKAYIEQYIIDYIDSQSYMTAVSLLERFSIQFSSESLLLKMIESNQFKAAEKWAIFMGRPMICSLVQKYVEMKMLKNAYDIIKRNSLMEEFPDVYQSYKESLLKKLAEKGLWDLAELRTKKDGHLLKYLVYLAMEAGYNEKVDELCERYSLEGFAKVSVPDETSSRPSYLDVKKLFLEDIIWVDEINGLLTATEYIEGCQIVGIDCEWKPNYEKGVKPNKVSILQISSENRAFIFDLIKLYEDEPKALDVCLRRILCSSNTLKLGYNLQCDLHQLSVSYGDLECFRSYEMLLDIQKLFKEPNGGLSGLAQKILGAGLNKTKRNSNWEQRPLTQNQKEYAAMDAAVLVHIFHHVRGQPHSGSKEEQCKVEWKSHIVSRMCNTRRSKSS